MQRAFFSGDPSTVNKEDFHFDDDQLKLFVDVNLFKLDGDHEDQHLLVFSAWIEMWIRGSAKYLGIE